MRPPFISSNQAWGNFRHIKTRSADPKPAHYFYFYQMIHLLKSEGQGISPVSRPANRKRLFEYSMQGDEFSGIRIVMRGLWNDTGSQFGLGQWIYFFGILIKNKLPTVLPLVVFEKVDIIIIRLHFKITGPLAIPAIDDICDFVTSIHETEGDWPLVKHIAWKAFHRNHAVMVWRYL